MHIEKILGDNYDIIQNEHNVIKNEHCFIFLYFIIFFGFGV